MRRIFILVCGLSLVSCSATYYVVRHAEKEAATANMGSDVELSPAGEARAIKLQQLLRDKRIGYIYSTNTKRTTGTAKPLSDAIGVPVQIYNPADTGFVQKLKELKGNVLIVGHSNTVDDIVNRFTGRALLKDLADSEYNNLFIIQKRGKRYQFSRSTYGD